jgi:hypothetical protein
MEREFDPQREMKLPLWESELARDLINRVADFYDFGQIDWVDRAVLQNGIDEETLPGAGAKRHFRLPVDINMEEFTEFVRQTGSKKGSTRAELFVGRRLAQTGAAIGEAFREAQAPANWSREDRDQFAHVASFFGRTSSRLIEVGAVLDPGLPQIANWEELTPRARSLVLDRMGIEPGVVHNRITRLEQLMARVSRPEALIERYLTFVRGSAVTAIEQDLRRELQAEAGHRIALIGYDRLAAELDVPEAYRAGNHDAYPPIIARRRRRDGNAFLEAVSDLKYNSYPPLSGHQLLARVPNRSDPSAAAADRTKLRERLDQAALASDDLPSLEWKKFGERFSPDCAAIKQKREQGVLTAAEEAKFFTRMGDEINKYGGWAPSVPIHFGDLYHFGVASEASVKDALALGQMICTLRAGLLTKVIQETGSDEANLMTVCFGRHVGVLVRLVDGGYLSVDFALTSGDPSVTCSRPRREPLDLLLQPLSQLDVIPVPTEWMLLSHGGVEVDTATLHRGDKGITCVNLAVWANALHHQARSRQDKAIENERLNVELMDMVCELDPYNPDFQHYLESARKALNAALATHSVD